jgi:hypothetical protein
LVPIHESGYDADQVLMPDEKKPEPDDTPDTPPTEPEPVPMKEPPPPPEKRGPYISSVVFS